MDTDSKQIINSVIGYGLLLIGVFVMILSVFQVYRVFTKQAQPIRFFNFPAVKMDLASLAPQLDTSALDSLKKQLNVGDIKLPTSDAEVSPRKETELISAEVLNGPANLGVYLLFMGFLMNFGYRLAGLGIKLVRPIVVKGVSQP